MSQLKAVLALEDGTLFSGIGFGAPGASVGEAVFNTAMTGYQEILTDPSYAGQLVTLTMPHIGNTGVNPEDMESDRPRAAGLIVRDCPRRVSSWRATQSLPEWLEAGNVIAIGDIDTRALTVKLRETGAQNGCILSGRDVDPAEALERARSCPPMVGRDLAKPNSCAEPHEWSEGSPAIESRAPSPGSRHVVVYDFGAKYNILRLLVDAGCRLTVVPADFPLDRALALEPDGVMLSNGPGDPEPCGYAVETIRGLIGKRVPTFGICLGHQLLALAAGARTVKMKFGHHGANHPVQDLETGRVMITSQNHGFAVDGASLPEGVVATHRSLFDGTLQGIRLENAPAFGFQGHPEASPGPHDLRGLFEAFVEMMSRSKNNLTADERR
ncbi:MAG: glutamine-hydrolyzing carbamoyl-phosphate synthase small subunit [Wenzhouxiangellaceae bacterium]|nr:glutamine-hydrolyzing carbamoyl-phosphate synthase small subunit [Wenzhouxiangellaceae bacterium]